MEITTIIKSKGFECLDIDERSDAFEEYLEKCGRLQHTGEMLALLDGRVWVITNEYDVGELTATFLLPSEY